MYVGSHRGAKAHRDHRACQVGLIAGPVPRAALRVFFSFLAKIFLTWLEVPSAVVVCSD